MQSTTLRAAIPLAMIFAVSLIQLPASQADDSSRIIEPVLISHDGQAQAALPNGVTEETVIIMTDDEISGSEPTQRKIKIIRAGSPNALDSTALHHVLKQSLNDKNLPPDVLSALHDALNQDNHLQDMNVDVIVNDQGGHHLIVRDFNHAKPDMDHRMRPNQGIHWMEKAPPDEAAPLNEKAAECILKSLTKVTTESGTRLLREACQAAYPDVSN